MLVKKALNKIRNFFKLSVLKRNLKIIALGCLGFAMGKFFGLGAIVSGAIVYRKAFSIKVSVVDRLFTTILGCLIGGIIATILGNVIITVIPLTTLLKFISLAVIAISVGVVMSKVTRSKRIKKLFLKV